MDSSPRFGSTLWGLLFYSVTTKVISFTSSPLCPSKSWDLPSRCCTQSILSLDRAWLHTLTYFRVFPPFSLSLLSLQLLPLSCNSLIHYTISIQSLLFLLLVFLCCLVSCFPSQYSPLSITLLSLCFVGGSTFFRPPFFYFRTLNRFPSFSWVSMLLLLLSFATTPCLSLDSSPKGTKMFQFPLSSLLSYMLSLSGISVSFLLFLLTFLLRIAQWKWIYFRIIPYCSIITPSLLINLHFSAKLPFISYRLDSFYYQLLFCISGMLASSYITTTPTFYLDLRSTPFRYGPSRTFTFR